jgi:DNA anti-recombination protein RmuC
MLIQQNAAQARQLVIALKARNKKQGLFADVSLQMSIEDYERALRLFTTAATDPAQAEYISTL